jgi:RNA polymerase sigma-70 factor, ECF subfamily
MPKADTPPPCTSCDWIGVLARQHAGRLAAIARREGLPPADALDVVQDAFRTLLSRPDLRTKPDDAARLLTTITRNAARNSRRRHHRAKQHSQVEALPLASPEPAPSESLERAVVTAQLGGCMAALGEVHRDVVTLRVLEELSGDEVAKALGLTPGNVAVLLHRARKQLERCMREA